ncbi:hypothetical protein YC2023_033058 [Brassica napus]
MDTAQGGDLVSQLDPSEVLPSYRAEHTDRVIPSVHSVHTDHILPSERDDQTFRTIPSDHPDRTARAVHRIDPHTSRIELSLEPRPRDGIDRSTSLLSRPSRQDKTDGRARIHLGREESKDGRRFSLIALFVRPACPEGYISLRKESQAVPRLVSRQYTSWSSGSSKSSVCSCGTSGGCVDHPACVVILPTMDQHDQN